MNAPRYLLLVILGISIIGWGLPAAHRLKAPHDLFAAIAVLAGLIMMILGALLTILPRFFLE